MNFAQVGIKPQRTADPVVARLLVEQDGAVILQRAGLSEADARAVGFAVFGPSLLAVPSGVKVSSSGDRRRRPAGTTNESRSHCHTSGYSYGEHYPDYVVLLCQWQSEVGGESVLVDGYALLDQMAEDPRYADLANELSTTAIDQTDPGMQPLIRPIVGSTDRGRRAIVMANRQHVRLRNDSPNPDADQAMIDRWRGTVEAATDQIEHVKLRNGEALIIDNYRVVHGREPYQDTRRTLWRLWLWTEHSAQGMPSVPLHSDNRHAHVA